MAMANELADPDKVAEMFKAEFNKAFPHHALKLTEDDVKSADFVRMKLFGKPIDYLLEEEEKIEPKRYRGKKSRRYPTAARKHHSRMRQRVYRLEKDIFKAFR
jgi:hypothetical protein